MKNTLQIVEENFRAEFEENFIKKYHEKIQCNLDDDCSLEKAQLDAQEYMIDCVGEKLALKLFSKIKWYDSH